MPLTECIGCGAPYEANPDLSVDSMKRKVRRTTLISLISILVAIVCVILTWINSPPAKYVVPYESTGDGIVRYYNGPKRELLHENFQGYMKMLSPICSTEIPVWSGMHANITFKWVPDNFWKPGAGPTNGQSCYEITSVREIK